MFRDKPSAYDRLTDTISDIGVLILAFLVKLPRGGAIPPPRLNPVPDHRTAVRLRESSQLYGWWHSYGYISATYLPTCSSLHAA